LHPERPGYSNLNPSRDKIEAFMDGFQSGGAASILLPKRPAAIHPET
jgi:hypothetical protein